MNPWRGEWLSNPLFKEFPPLNFLHKANVKPQHPEHPAHLQNLHTYFRKTFDLPSLNRNAHLKITADDSYRLFINGKLVGEGPATGYIFAYPYDKYDISDFLVAGKNVIAVDVYYQGLVNRVTCSGDYRQGLSAELSLGDRSILSDATWKMLTTRADTGTRILGYLTQYLEDVDSRRLPHGWALPHFDDAAWETPWVRTPEDAGYTLVPSGIEPLEVKKTYPSEIRRIAEGRYFIDFGREVVGSVGMSAKGEAGHVVEFRCGEELLEDGSVRHQMRCNCDYFDTWSLAGGEEEIQFYDYKSFRYLEVHSAPQKISEKDVWVLERHTPFHENAKFQSSSPILNRIWKICVRAVECTTQGAMLDCESREKGQYLGDAFVTALSHMYTQGNGRMTRKMIRDFALSSRICPGLMAVAPGNFMQEIADFSLLWPWLVEEYYSFTGDADFVLELVPVVQGLLRYFEKYENSNGLLERVDEKWNLVDWPENLRDGYDYKRAEDGVNTALNAWYQGCLQKSASLLSATGQEDAAQKALGKARVHRSAFNQFLLDPASGLYVDAQGSSHSSLHANALPLLFDIPEKKQIPAIINLIRKKKFSCGVFMSMFVLRALIRHGEYDLAYGLIVGDDIHSWQTMLNAGATACMEAWGPDQKWNTSWCHPWASAPVSLLPQFFMGLRSGIAGWKSLDFAPHTPRDLASASFSLQTFRGRVEYSHHWNSAEEVEYTLETPDDMPVVARLPLRGGVDRVTVNGQLLHGSIEGSWYSLGPLPGGKACIACIYRTSAGR